MGEEKLLKALSFSMEVEIKIDLKLHEKYYSEYLREKRINQMCSFVQYCGDMVKENKNPLDIFSVVLNIITGSSTTLMSYLTPFTRLINQMKQIDYKEEEDEKRLLIGYKDLSKEK